MTNQDKADKSSDHSQQIPVKFTALISLQKAAAQLDVSVDFIRKIIKAGKLKTYRLGRSLKVEQTSVEAYISKSSNGNV